MTDEIKIEELNDDDWKLLMFGSASQYYAQSWRIGNLYLDRKERGRRRHWFMTHGKHGKKRPR
jgi:hypothetical protein